MYSLDAKDGDKAVNVIYDNFIFRKLTMTTHLTS